MYIELTQHTNGGKITINTDKIVSIEEDNGHCVIYTEGAQNSRAAVIESYSTVIRLANIQHFKG